MSRRSTPEHLYAAQRAGVVRRLELEGELPDRAEARVAAWEARTAGDGEERDGRYWEAGWAWIAAQRCTGSCGRLASPSPASLSTITDGVPGASFFTITDVVPAGPDH